MASSLNPDLWSDLSGFGSSESATPEARAALLRVNAEMFVAAPARDRESIETFETLVLGFLPRADSATLLDLARILSPCPDTPASISDYLARHAPEAQAILQNRDSRPLSAVQRKHLATPAGRLRLASKPDLDPATMGKLLVLRESAVEDALAVNPALAPEVAPFTELLQRARHRPALARILLERTDLPATGEAALYLAADDARRRAIRERIAGLLAHRRVSLSCALTDLDVTDLMTAGLKGDVERLEALFTSAFGFPAAAQWRLLEIGRHRLLPLALKALGVTRRDTTRIVLSLHPALSSSLSAIKELVREARDVPAPVALFLVEAILGVRALSGEA
jgi:hypothetical protein